MNAKRIRHEISRANRRQLTEFYQSQLHGLQRRNRDSDTAAWWGLFFGYGCLFVCAMTYAVPAMIGGR